MSVFFICRHGETENNLAKHHQGWIDTPLTEKGIKNALNAAEKLKDKPIDKIVSSDLGRAFVTAYIIARDLEYTEEIERYSGFREINYGNLANLPYAAFPAADHNNPADFVYPKGESLNQMKQRILNSIQKLSQNYPDKVILIVAHDGTINAVRSAADHIDIAQADQTRNPHGFIASFEYKNGAVTDYREI